MQQVLSELYTTNNMSQKNTGKVKKKTTLYHLHAQVMNYNMFLFFSIFLMVYFSCFSSNVLHIYLKKEVNKFEICAVVFQQSFFKYNVTA